MKFFNLQSPVLQKQPSEEAFLSCLTQLFWPTGPHPKYISIIIIISIASIISINSITFLPKNEKSDHTTDP